METNSYPVALFDMSINDLQERVSKRIVFKKAIMAANFLGMVPHNFYERLKPGRYVYHRETGKKYAARKVKQ